MANRLGLMVSDEILDALESEKTQTGATASNIVRLALVEYLNKRGHRVKDAGLEWGGWRERKEKQVKE